MVAGSRCWLASGLPLSARSRQHRLCRIKCRTRRDDRVPAQARFRLCRRRPRLRWQSRLRRRARAPELQTPVCLNGEKWRAALSLDFQPTLVVYHINCHLVVENQALRVLPNWRESADQVFCRENAPLHQFSSLFTLYTGESNQSIVPEAAVSWS